MASQKTAAETHEQSIEERRQPSLIFVNGEPAPCRCMLSTSSGGGEFSDVAEVKLCHLHQASAVHAARLVEILKRITQDEVLMCSDSEYEFADGTKDVDKGCGPWAKTDEDGCCVSCGNDLKAITVDTALALGTA